MANGLAIDVTQVELPGQGFDFQDVTRLFYTAGQELETDSTIFMDDFSLHDAMSSLEIGEPRLDTGLILQKDGQNEPNRKFDPRVPLLPEEVCWILDRALGFEMEFHSGNFLAHTVITLLYLHRLQDIDPDQVPAPSQHDPHRPIGLVTLVLRVAGQALLKSVDLVWRELAKGGMYDTEDWQSDKCEVSLLEGVPAAFIIKQLEGVINWVVQTPQLAEEAKVLLLPRLLLRQTLIQIFNTDNTNLNEKLKLISQARIHLRVLKAHPAPLEPIPPTTSLESMIPTQQPQSSDSSSPQYLSPTSPALLSFDPHVGRILQMASPMRVVPAPSIEQTYEMLDQLLDGIEDATLLARGGQERDSDDVATLGVWQVMSDTHLWLTEKNRPTQVPYARSLCQTTFYDGFMIMSSYSTLWLMNRFFYETCGVEWDGIRNDILDRWRGNGEDALVNGGSPPPILRLERLLSKMLIDHFQALFHNPPRRRRHFMKSVLEWHLVYDILNEIQDGMDLEDIPTTHLLHRLPSIALTWRLSIIREIVLSGFQLDLYVDEEKPFAYWYATQVIEEHLQCFDCLIQGIEAGTLIHIEMQFQIKFLSILQALCTALFVSTLPLLSFSWEHTRPNFYRRYKWAFRTEYDSSQYPVVAQPELWRFIRACGEILRRVGAHSDRKATDGDAEPIDIGVPLPADCVDLARTIAAEMVMSAEYGSLAGAWTQDRLRVVENLRILCEDLEGLPRTVSEVDNFDPKVRFDWDFHPWFPKIRGSR